MEVANPGTQQVAPEHSYSRPAEAMHSSGHSDAQSSLHWWMPWHKADVEHEEYPPMQTIQLRRTHQKTQLLNISEIKALETLPSCTECGHNSVHGVHGFVGFGRLVGGLRPARAFCVESAGREAWLAGRTSTQTTSLIGKATGSATGGWILETWNCGTQPLQSFCDFLFCPIVPKHKTGDRIPFRCQQVYLQKEHSKNVWAGLQPAILLIFVDLFHKFYFEYEFLQLFSNLATVDWQLILCEMREVNRQLLLPVLPWPLLSVPLVPLVFPEIALLRGPGDGALENILPRGEGDADLEFAELMDPWYFVAKYQEICGKI